MIASIAAVTSLLLSVTILVAGNGLQNTLISVRANLEAFPMAQIGFLISGYFAGYIAGSFAGPQMIKRVGHIRAFAALAAIAAAAALTQALLVDPWVWTGLRAITGFCFVGLYMIIESWLNERTPNETRGRMLSLYRMIELSAVLAGQLLLTIADPAGFTLFCIVSILICLALVPVALTKAEAPAPIRSARIRLLKLYRLSPLGMVGAFIIGVANGAFWGLAPIFIQNAGLSIDTVAYFMSFCVLGGIVFQWPIGRLSDRFDRRTVLIIVCFLGAASAAGLVVVSEMSLIALFILAVFYGGLTMPLWPLSVAHTNDYVEPREFVETSGGLLLTFGIGAIIGPSAASFVMQAFGGWALFAFNAAAFGLLGLFGLYRTTRRAPVPMHRQEQFVPVTETTPAVFEFDPRGEATEPVPQSTPEAPSDDAEANRTSTSAPLTG
jgi:MFS family permease